MLITKNERNYGSCSYYGNLLLMYGVHYYICISPALIIGILRCVEVWQSRQVSFYVCLDRCTNTNLGTVEPRHTTTPNTTTLYYDHFFVARTKAHTFSYLKYPVNPTTQLLSPRTTFWSPQTLFSF